MEKHKNPEQFDRRKFVEIFLTICMLFAISMMLHSAGSTSKTENNQSFYEEAHELYAQIYGLMRQLPCAEYRFSTNIDVLQRHPELIDAYQQSLAHWLDYYSIDKNGLLASAIDDAIFREMFESGDLFLCLIDGFTISEVKAKMGDPIQRTMDDASIGLLDQKAYRMSLGVWSILPEDYRGQLKLADNGLHVAPDSLADFLNAGSVAQRMDRAILLAVATGTHVYPEAQAIATNQGVEDWDFQQILSYIICCSGPVEADPMGVGEYGWRILKNYQDGGKVYMQNPDSYNQFDHRGLDYLRQKQEE